MNWQHKALLQRVLSSVPGGEGVYYLLQRHVTKHLPQSEAKFREIFEVEARHIAAFKEHGNVPLGAAKFFQFGAGWTMAGPLIFHSLGVNQQILVDIRRLIKPWLINVSAERLQTLEFETPLVRRPEQLVHAHADEAVKNMQDWWGIDYRAPSDARSTNLPDNSIDCITSTNTLEHIPRQDIIEILQECQRILKPGGVMSFQVDYQDHYSYFDKSVTVYNYLKYSDEEWKAFNPSLHYQNRMRHQDYLDIYRNVGFNVIDDSPRYGSNQDLKDLSSIPVHDRYEHFTAEELAIRASYIVLTKPAVINRVAHHEQATA